MDARGFPCSAQDLVEAHIQYSAAIKCDVLAPYMGLKLLPLMQRFKTVLMVN